MSDGEASVLTPEQEERVRIAFLQLVHDGSDSLSREEFIQMVESSGNSGIEVYQTMDHGEDGSVSVEQYLEGFRKIALFHLQSSGSPTPTSPTSQGSSSQSPYRRTASQYSDVEATLNARLESLQTEKDHLLDQMVIRDDQLRAAQDSIQQLTEDLERTKWQLEDWELKYTKAHDTLKERQIELVTANDELRSLKAQYEDIAQQLHQSQSTSQHAEHEMETLQERLRELDAAHSTRLTQLQQEMSEKLKEKEDQLYTLKKQVESLAERAKEAESVKLLEDKIATLEAALVRVRERNDKLTMDFNSSEAENQLLQRELADWKKSHVATSSSSASLSTPGSIGKASSLKLRSLFPSTPTTTSTTPASTMMRSSSTSLTPSGNPSNGPTMITVSPGSSPRGLNYSSSGNHLNLNGSSEIPVSPSSASLSTPGHGMTPSNSGSSISRRFSTGEDVTDAFSLALRPSAAAPPSVTPTAPVPAPESPEFRQQISDLQSRLQKIEADYKREKNARMVSEAENNDLKETISQLNEDLHKRDARYDELRRSSQQALNSSALNEALSSQLSAERERSAGLETRLSDLNTTHQSLEAELDALNANYELKQQELNTVLAQLRSTQDSHDSQLKAIQELEASSKTREEAMKVQYEAALANSEKLQAELSKTTRMLSKAEEEFREQQELRGRISELENEKEMWDRSNTDWQSKLDRERQRVADLQHELDELRRQMDSNRMSEDKGALVQQLQTEMEDKIKLVDALQLDVSSLTQSHKDAKERSETLDRDIIALNQELNVLNTALETSRSECASLADQLKERQQGFDSSMNELNEQLKLSQTALEAETEKSRLLTVELVSSTAMHGETASKLQEEHVNKVKQLEALLEEAEERLKISNSKLTGFETELLSQTQNHKLELSSVTSQLNNEIQDLKKQIETLETSLSSETSTTASMSAELESLRTSQAHNDLSKQQEFKSTIEQLRKELEAKEDEIALLRQEHLQASKNAQTEHETRVSALQSEVSAIQALLESARSDLASLRLERDSERASRESEQKTAAEALETLEHRLQEASTRNLENESKIESLASDLSQIQADRAKEAEYAREQHDVALKEVKDRLAAAEERLSSELVKSAALQRELEELREKVASEAQVQLERQVVVLKESVEEKEKEIEESRAQVSELNMQLTEATTEKETLKGDVVRLRTQLTQVVQMREASRTAVDEAKSQLDGLFAQFKGYDEDSDEDDSLEATKHKLELANSKLFSVQLSMDQAETAHQKREEIHEEELEAAGVQLEEATAKIDSLTSALAVAVKELEDMKNDVAAKDYAVQVAFAKTENERIQQDAAAVKTKLEAQLALVMAQSDESQATVHTLREKLQEVGEAQKEAEAKAQARITSLETEVAALLTQSALLSAAQQAEQASHEQNLSLKKQHSELQRQYAQLQEKLKHLQTELGDAHRQIAYLQPASPNSSQPSSQPSSPQPQNYDAEAAEEIVSALNLQLRTLQARNTELTHYCEQADQDIATLKATLQLVQEQAKERLDKSQTDAHWMADKESQTAILRKEIEELKAKLLHHQQQAAKQDTRVASPASPSSSTTPTKPGHITPTRIRSSPRTQERMITEHPISQKQWQTTTILLSCAPIVVLLYLFLVHSLTFDTQFSYQS